MNVGSLTWDVARAGGLLAYALLAASVAMGLVLSLGWRSPRWTRFVTTEVHRFVTLLSLVFVVIHGTAIALDPFIKMGVPDVLVPFLGPYRPAWVALGIIAAYLALAVYLSERVRGRVGYAWWRRFHALAFVAFAMALMHGIATGSDTRTPWALALYGGSLFLVGFLLILRLFPEEPKRSRPVAAGLAIMAVAGAIGFSLVGPLQPGWSARAGGATATGATSSSGAASATGGDPGAGRARDHGVEPAALRRHAHPARDGTPGPGPDDGRFGCLPRPARGPQRQHLVRPGRPQHGHGPGLPGRRRRRRQRHDRCDVLDVRRRQLVAARRRHAGQRRRDQRDARGHAGHRRTSAGGRTGLGHLLGLARPAAPARPDAAGATGRRTRRPGAAARGR
jgi:hypothetical protein